jgi:ADP-heptose:LPS heptosyltransferase
MQLRTQRSIDNYVGRLAIALLRPVAMVLGAVLRRDHRLAVGREVIFMKMLGGGSLLLGMPMLLGFRRAHPTVKMILITTPSVKPFADMIGVFDEYRVIDVRSGGAALSSATRVLWQSLRADCIIDLEVHSRLTTVFTTLTMARNRVSFWLEDIFWRRGLASHLIFFNKASGSYHFYDRIADLFGFPVVDRADCRAALIRTCDIDVTRPMVDRVCIGFACSDLGQERMLSAEQWVRVFRENLRAEHRTFAFLGGPADRARGETIIAALRAEFPRLTLLNRCGELTLNQSVAVLFESPEFWGIDSSLLHQARVAGLRCLSYWGPTDPATRLRSTWQIDERVVYRKIACSPCVHTSEEPPCRGDNRCIQGLFDPERAPLGWTPIEYPQLHTR